MKLERVEVQRLRGAAAGFELEGVAAGLNLVLGPNGSGKSSLCDALRSMLWPESGAVPGTELVAWWIEDGADAKVRLRGELHSPGRSAVALVEWQRDGSSTSRPDVPASQVAPVYRLGLVDLLEEDHPDDLELAAKIRIEMSGGFDLSQVRSSLAARHGSSQERARHAAAQARDKLLGERRQLAFEDDALAELRADLELAGSSREEIEPLGQALELARLRGKIADLEASLRGLEVGPEVLDQMLGGEHKAFETLRADRGEAESERASARQAVDELETERSALELPEPRPGAAALEQLRELAASLREADDARRRESEAFDSARHAAGAAARTLAGEIDVEQAAGLDGDAIEKAAGWVGRAVGHAGQRARVQALVDAAGAGPRDPRAIKDTADQVRRRADALREWLSSPLAGPASSRVGDWAALCSGLAVGVAAWWMSLWLLLLAGLLLGFGLARLLVPADPGAGVRAALEARFREWPATGDADTDASCRSLRFEAATVRRAVEEIDARCVHLERLHEEAVAHGEHRRELAVLDEEARELDENRAALAKRLGIDPGFGAVSFADLTERIRRYREVETLRAEAEARYASAEGVVEERRRGLLGELPPGIATDDTLPRSLAQVADRLVAACQSEASLLAALEQAQGRVQRAGVAGVPLAERRAELLGRAGVSAHLEDEAAAAQLERRLEVYGEYIDIAEQRRAAASRAGELERGLADRPELLAIAPREAEERLAEARERATQISRIADAIARTEERVEAAVASGALDAAEADLARAEADVVARRDELVVATAGDFLLDDVEAEYERHTQPALLRVASELFARFTHHRYRLDVARVESGGAFRAIETESGRGLALGELSDGTRMQLLLAARLSFAVHAEASQHPPLFLDEALTASDPGRFRAVAEALLELADEGRQIFYLTCNPADVALFEQIGADLKAPALRVFRLAELRGLATAFGDVSELAVPPREPVPAPGDDPPERYAMRIGVPKPSPHEGVEGLHLFHVLRDDLPTLHRLIDQARVEVVGQWRSARQSPAIQRVLDESARARVDAAVGVAERFLEAYAIGRGRPVDRAVLEGTDAVSDSFIERLAVLAREVDGDAQALVDAIAEGRVSHFRSDKLEQLSDALEASGHLDPATPLDADALRVRALAGLRAGEAGSSAALDLPSAQRVIDWLQTLYRPAPRRAPPGGQEGGGR